MKKVPILFLIFKRKQQALESFKSIREYQPDTLYISADGPRTEVLGEDVDCEETRNVVLSSIDWECDVKTLFRKHNLGCTDAVNEGISWFFDNEEYGIIIEDDVVVSLDFFYMCEKLLPLYKEKSEIMLISSRNHSNIFSESNEYSFTYYANIWGWATWKRAWLLNTKVFSEWNSFSKIDFIKRMGIIQGLFFLYYYFKCRNPSIKFGSWDYTWSYHIYKNNGICIIPNVNLSKNVGIGIAGSTNYSEDDKDPYIHLGIGKIKWPLKIKDKIVLNKIFNKKDRQDFFRLRLIGLRKKIKHLF